MHLGHFGVPPNGCIVGIYVRKKEREREEKEERDELERLSLERQRRGGVMVPSQCRMVLAMCEAAEVWKERVEFWEDVYG